MVVPVPLAQVFEVCAVISSSSSLSMTVALVAAGIPTLIKPWFGDQYFWASRVQRLGVSFCTFVAGLCCGVDVFPRLECESLCASLTSLLR